MTELKELTSSVDWRTLLNDSKEKPVLLLKHSTTCPISANAWKEFNTTLEALTNQGVQTAFVKVIESRPVSNQIAEELGVTHQSPQLILIKDEKPAWTTSHWDIKQDAILREAK